MAEHAAKPRARERRVALKKRRHVATRHRNGLAQLLIELNN
jgi:hypothetical protein